MYIGYVVFSLQSTQRSPLEPMPNLGFETLRDPFYGSPVVGLVTDVVRNPGCFISVTTSLGKRVMRADIRGLLQIGTHPLLWGERAVPIGEG